MATIIYWQDDETGQTESVQFDAVQSESHEDTLAITEHPVEQGANITDHARELPARFSVEGYVSTIPNAALDDDAVLELIVLNVPTMADPGTKIIQLDVPGSPLQPSLTGLLQAGAAAVTSALTGGPNHRATVRGDIRRQVLPLRAQVLKQSTPRNRVRDVYDALLKAQSRKLLCTVATRFREHFDMLIERVAAPRTVEDGSKVLFQLDLKRIRIAASETVESPRPAEVRGQLTKSAGSQAVKTAPDPEPRRSLLRSGILSLGG